MANTAISSFSSGIASLLQNGIFPQIITWLKENKECEVTISELYEACSLEAPISSKPSFFEKAKAAKSSRPCSRKIERKGQDPHDCTRGATEEVEGEWFCTSCAKIMKKKKSSSPKVEEKKKLITKSLKINGKSFSISSEDNVLIEYDKEKDVGYTYGVWDGEKLTELSETLIEKYNDYGMINKKPAESGVETTLKPITNPLLRKKKEEPKKEEETPVKEEVVKEVVKEVEKEEEPIKEVPKPIEEEEPKKEVVEPKKPVGLVKLKKLNTLSS